MNLKETICLFETTMPIKINIKQLDENMYSFFNNNKINEKIFKINKKNTAFVLHDGPPYANGPIHLGHAYNKIMKDICIRSRFMMGYNAYSTPGWDCHGLPIEHKVTQENKDANKLTIKQACRKYANYWVEKQKESFQKLGICMDFNAPYKTMNFQYQATIAKSFAQLVEKGYINRANKTIPWCCGCQTSLATAEIEYINRKDPSIYVLFHLVKNNNTHFLYDTREQISLVIWTTTPWTLPLNRAVMIKKNATYLLIKYDNTYLIIGKDCLNYFEKITQKNYEIIIDFVAERLINCFTHHPFEENSLTPIILEEAVEIGEGTACVHSAPGCGPIDYEIGIKNHLEIYSPISPDGKYTEEIKIDNLKNMSISDAQGWVITNLFEKKMLWHKGSINHSYPHCWRSKEGLIFRATPQWFCNLEKNNFKEKVIEAIEKIQFFPTNSKFFLKSTILNRWEWCISRQRSWGVPIIALINKKNNSYWTTPEFIRYVSNQIEIYGVEYWDDISLESLKNILPQDIDINDWKKETDILDVWFDSGISHEAVLQRENKFPADVYLEGVDQHRGWFQSSLLTSIAMNNIAPMKNIISCGHTVDEKGQKMSKSIGNVISPEDIVNQIGLDGLRMWVSSVNLGGDIVVGKKIFENIAEVYRKIRNTCRFAIQNLVDFDPTTDMISFNDLEIVEQLIIKKMFIYQIKIINSYQQYNFPDVFNTLIEINTSFLSSFYFDTIKDILYCDKQNWKSRRKIQTTIYIILESLSKLIAPIMINTSEDITNHYKSNKKESVHLETFSKFDCLKTAESLKNSIFQLKEDNPFHEENIKILLDKIHHAEFLEKQKTITETNKADYLINIIQIIRGDIFKETELLRQQNIIKQSIESKIIFNIEKNSKYYLFFKILYQELGNEFIKILCQLTLISEINIINKEILFEDETVAFEHICSNQCNTNCYNNYNIKAEKHTGNKCQRCWKYFYQKNTENICQRCENAIK